MMCDKFLLIAASCLSYGHSCWGAHGKRSYVPQRELNPGEPSDRWAIFKFMPERVILNKKKLFVKDFPNFFFFSERSLTVEETVPKQPKPSITIEK